MPRKPHDLASALRKHFETFGVADVVSAERYNLGQGGFVIQVATRCRGSSLVIEPLRYPISNAVAFWSDSYSAHAFLADALDGL